MSDEILIEQDERIDDLHRKGYKIIQNPKKFCFGMDAVLLTGFAKVNQNEIMLDLGTGTGIIPILMEAKNSGNRYFGIDIQDDSVNMALRSVKLNNIEDKVQIIKADIKNLSGVFPLSHFDVITSNPPYMNNGKGLKNAYLPKAIARHEILCNLEDVIRTTSKHLKVLGRFYMVHRPHRLIDILTLLREYKLEPKRIRFVYPYVDKEPNMVLIESVRHGKPMLKVEPPLIVYNKDGTYKDEIYRIYGMK